MVAARAHPWGKRYDGAVREIEASAVVRAVIAWLTGIHAFSLNPMFAVLPKALYRTQHHHRVSTSMIATGLQARRMLVAVPLMVLVCVLPAYACNDGRVGELEPSLSNAEERVDQLETALESSEEENTEVKSSLAASELKVNELETSLTTIKQERDDLQRNLRQAQAEIDGLKSKYDQEIRVSLIAEVDAEVERACQASIENYERPISSRWIQQWGAVTTREEIENRVEKCAAPERTRIAAQQEAERRAYAYANPVELTNVRVSRGSFNPKIHFTVQNNRKSILTGVKIRAYPRNNFGERVGDGCGYFGGQWTWSGNWEEGFSWHGTIDEACFRGATRATIVITEAIWADGERRWLEISRSSE